MEKTDNAQAALMVSKSKVSKKFEMKRISRFLITPIFVLYVSENCNNNKKMRINFKSENFGDSPLRWMNEPQIWKQSESDGLLIHMDAKHDFWRKTYYKPLLISNNGHIYFNEFPSEGNVMVETSFTLNAVNQFDQAGLMVYLDEEHWIKTGIEHTDGLNRLSCVVTNGYSDWSTQDFPLSNLTIRLYKLGSDYVVEAKKENGEFSFIRICHLENQENSGPVKVGLYAAAPSEKGGSVAFEYILFDHTIEGYHHTN